MAEGDPPFGARGASPPLPLPNTYWVIPGLLLAGEHPSGETAEETRERVQRLLDAGVRCFIDLTYPGEVEAYDIELPVSIDYWRKPIRDHGIPAKREHMVEIQACLHNALKAGLVTYVHCRAGIGRTGMTIGCFLVEQGHSGDAAVDELNRLWQQCARCEAWPSVPETDQQCDFIRDWKPQLGKLFDDLKAPAPPQAFFAAPASAAVDDPLLDDTGTLRAVRSLRDRFLGALIGLAVGDALAAATQFRAPGSFNPIGDLLGGGPFDLPRGGWSDDTAMALCLAESLLERNGFDPRDQVARYCRWQQQGHLSATGQCLGITASTAKALGLAQWRRQLYSGSHDPGQLDPEVLSRVAPVVLFHFAQPADALHLASEQARTTCQAPAAMEACRVLAACLCAALSGRAKPAVLTPGPEFLDLASLRTAARNVAERAGNAATPRAGQALEVLEAALWAFRTTDSFRDGALKAANLGQSSDVTACVFGQLAGAYYGVGAIPAAWRTSLIGKELIESFADRLLAHAMVGLAG